MAICREFSQQT